MVFFYFKILITILLYFILFYSILCCTEFRAIVVCFYISNPALLLSSKSHQETSRLRKNFKIKLDEMEKSIKTKQNKTKQKRKYKNQLKLSI